MYIHILDKISDKTTNCEYMKSDARINMCFGLGRSSWKALGLGIRWGMGHSAGLVIVALLFIALKGEFDMRAVSHYLNVFVGVFMIMLGIHGMFLAIRERYFPAEEKIAKYHTLGESSSVNIEEASSLLELDDSGASSDHHDSHGGGSDFEATTATPPQNRVSSSSSSSSSSSGNSNDVISSKYYLDEEDLGGLHGNSESSRSHQDEDGMQIASFVRSFVYVPFYFFVCIFS